MTEEMLALALANTAKTAAANVEFLKGTISKPSRCPPIPSTW
ncbi:hypothetical protein [Streptomyces sp. NPDC048663]